MKPLAYYNEHDPFAAQWLRNLIDERLIAPGVVDERDIRDVFPDDIKGFTQCHFFAGIGGWSLALRLAGWPDDRPVWSGSCPCQPFSAAGQRLATADERHLWPAWHHLIKECRPDVVFGEQVEAAIAHGWLDLVCDDLEGICYAVGAAVVPAAGVGAPHVRHRLWFVAESDSQRRDRKHALLRRDESGRDAGADSETAGNGSAGNMAYADIARPQGRRLEKLSERADEWTVGKGGNTGGFWYGCDWIACRDGKRRPVEPGTFPLASGIPGRVGKLRAYGNAIVPQVAAEIIRAVM